MSEYSTGFSAKLVEAAQFVADDGLDSDDAIRTVLYLSKVACEILLKALLEKAGKPVTDIKSRRHDLAALLRDLGGCKVEEEIANDFLTWVSATRIRAVTLDNQYGNATIGTILTSEERGASKYPNEIRYGESFRDYPAELWLKTARAVLAWAEKHWDKIRV